MNRKEAIIKMIEGNYVKADHWEDGRFAYCNNDGFFWIHYDYGTFSFNTNSMLETNWMIYEPKIPITREESLR